MTNEIDFYEHFFSCGNLHNLFFFIANCLFMSLAHFYIGLSDLFVVLDRYFLDMSVVGHMYYRYLVPFYGLPFQF